MSSPARSLLSRPAMDREISEPLCRMRTSTSALSALGRLSSPSPILTASHLLTACTSGEIPIFLCSTSDTFLRSPPFPLPETPSTPSRISTSLSAETVDTVLTAGTFGPSEDIGKGNINYRLSGLQSHQEKRPNALGQLDDDLFVSSLRSSYLASALDALQPENQSGTKRGHAYAERHTSGHRSSEFLPQSPVTAVIASESTRSTQAHCTANISSLNSSPTGSWRSGRVFTGLRQSHEQHDFQALDSQGSWATQLSSLSFVDTIESAPCSPVTSDYSLPTSPRHSIGGSSLDPVPELLPAQHSKFAALPGNALWLKDLVVELSIDQEGFRAIKPVFKLTGYSLQARLLDTESDQQAEVAEFMPVKRQAFTFHYASFDGAPALRRITLNGDETRDYISRQASLLLKCNGVYTVRGIETSCIPSTSIPRSKNGPESATKLRWKFDYLVGDRKVDGTGKAIGGEKTLTPLTFSCSPFLLHILQGKKIRLMHVMRKSVVPKLVAEKLEPPKCPLPPNKSDILDAKTNAGFHIAQKTADPQSWILHRRTRSHIPHCEGEVQGSPTSWNVLSIGNGENVPPSHNALQPRRRRASSAGEQVRNGDRRRSNPKPHLPQSGTVARSIIPRSQLRELWSASLESSSQTDSGGLRALAPSGHQLQRTASPARL